MKLLRVHIILAESCGGLLDGLDVRLRGSSTDYDIFDPLCFVGPNGSGKSQFLQVVAEIFQSIFHECLPDQERVECNPHLQFEIECLIGSLMTGPRHIRLSRREVKKNKLLLTAEFKTQEGWEAIELKSSWIAEFLPQKIVGYTSGNNETLSLPFLISRSGYADEVGRMALNDPTGSRWVDDTRLMLIDYGTHLEVLVANLLFGDEFQRTALLEDSRLQSLHSFRCVIQLAHSAAPKINSKGSRKRIQLTSELESYIEELCGCATCFTYDEKTETYIMDFWVNEQTKDAFRYFWAHSLDLYSSFHKFAMLNDLVLPKSTRNRIQKDTRTRRFASRLPEPPDEEKVFRFESVRFLATKGEHVDYVSLSDGEHQLGQLLGTMCMVSFSSVLFLLDEPESHFNPNWRVKFISRLLELPTDDGKRSEASSVAKQECILTTHAPFVPSDMARDKVFIFSKEEGKVSVRHPDIQTYGTNFDIILEECFDVCPPISNLSRQEIGKLMVSQDTGEIKKGINRLGDSVEKVFLADRLRRMPPEGAE